MAQELVHIPAETTLGPAMRALPNDLQRRFVIALLEIGQINYTRAAAMAGYSAVSGNSLTVQAHRLAHDDRVLAAIAEESARRLHSGSAMAVSQLLMLANSTPKVSDQLKAIEMVLNRVGMHAMSEHKVVVQDTSATDDAMIERIKHLAGELGLDATKLLGRTTAKEAETASAPPVDAEFTEHAYTGLEDML